MPQLDHYNFTLAYISFSVCFFLTIVLFATVYLPMMHRHQKVNEFLTKELIAREKITEIEANTISEAKEQFIIRSLNKFNNK